MEDGKKCVSCDSDRIFLRDMCVTCYNRDYKVRIELNWLDEIRNEKVKDLFVLVVLLLIMKEICVLIVIPNGKGFDLIWIWIWLKMKE